tara:strand:- start:252 stop:734 length:483 start_codon:yes stop_codon:yes gene_type:complete
MTYKFNSTLKNSKYLITNHTSVQTTSNSSNTYSTLLGSEISYEPSENSSKVIYEISFYSEKQGLAFTGAYLEHYVSGAWSEINQRYRKNWGLGGSTTNQMNRWPIYWRFVLPSWSGERSLRIRLAHHTTNRQINLHQITHWDGTTATDQFCNTNLVVYSI